MESVIISSSIRLLSVGGYRLDLHCDRSSEPLALPRLWSFTEPRSGGELRTVAIDSGRLCFRVVLQAMANG